MSQFEKLKAQAKANIYNGKHYTELIEAIESLEETIAQQAAVIEQMQKTIQIAAEQIRKCDYTPARSTLLCVMKDFK